MVSRVLLPAIPLDRATAPANLPQAVIAPASPALPPAPPLLDGFEPLRLVAAGGLCDVWQVRDRLTGNVYALKQLSAAWVHDATAGQLLRNEAAAGLAVRSGHVVRVFRADLDTEPPRLLVEWLAGVSLEDALQRAGRLDVPRAVWIARQCVAGLIDLAAAGFSHGDVKPGNILLSDDGAARLIDLGFACRHDGADSDRDRGGQSLLGTPEYLAPETMARGRLSPISLDVYSLGVTLFRMLAGRLPFHDATVAGVLRLGRQARPPRLERFGIEAPARLFDLVGRMLAKQPLRRPSCLRTLWRELVKIELHVMASIESA
ncbi:MAG TPA: serine/threonine-protein kinase [Planctomycetaceae bacterium]|nr:serine/threonine-protein kinase [Planctomycetaceae bacterium]